MRFAPQPRAFFQHLNLKKWPEPIRIIFKDFDLKMFAPAACHFSRLELQKLLRWGVSYIWLENALRARAAWHLSTSELQKLVRSCGVLYILTWKFASRQVVVVVVVGSGGLRFTICFCIACMPIVGVLWFGKQLCVLHPDCMLFKIKQK